MEILKYEIKKLFNKPIVIFLAIGLLLLNIGMVFLGTFSDEPGYSLSYNKEKLEEFKENALSFKGVIDEEWTEDLYRMKNELVADPENMLEAEERELVKKSLLETGLTEEVIESDQYRFYFLKEEILVGSKYQGFEEAELASKFYYYADREGRGLAENYRSLYKDRKGEALAQQSEKMYGYLSSQYQAYYDYSWGWSRLHALQSLLPITLGLFLIVALSPLFSQEYSASTDALILTSKYGKSKLIKIKIALAFFLSLIAWLTITLINLLLIWIFFGLEGSRGFLQNWAMNPSPYAFTYLSSYIKVVSLSFLGLLFSVSIIIFVSSRSKRSFRSLAVNGLIMLLPALLFNIFNNRSLRRIFMFLPGKILVAVDHFKGFDAIYILGKVIMLPNLVIIIALCLTLILTKAAYSSFKEGKVIS